MIERAGIPTVSTTVLREITEKVGPPRALFLDRPFGYPLGLANDAAVQGQIIAEALGLVSRPVEEPLLADTTHFRPDPVRVQ